MDRVEHDLNDEQWTELKAAWGGCAYCGAKDKPLQRDCVLALSRGGRYTLENIAPACGSCNASKCNEEVTGWLRRKRLDERVFLLRYLEINAMRWPATRRSSRRGHQRRHLHRTIRMPHRSPLAHVPHLRLPLVVRRGV